MTLRAREKPSHPRTLGPRIRRTRLCRYGATSPRTFGPSDLRTSHRRTVAPSHPRTGKISKVHLPVDDPSDPRLDDYRNVPDAELLRQRGIFVAEGRLVVRRLLTTSRFATRSVLVTPTAFDAMRDLLDERDFPVYQVEQRLLDTIAGFNIHRGCLAIGVRGAELDWRTLAGGSRLVLVERVANADNVGAIFRNAAAFGAAGVLLEASCTDPLYRKAIRTSMGTALSMPFARLDPWPGALGDLR